MTLLRSALTFALCLSAASVAMPPATAASPFISITPGEYEMTNNMADAKSRQCFKDDMISADTLREQMKVSDNNQCKIVDSGKEGEALIVDLQCQYDEGVAGAGRMTVTSSGKTLTIRSQFKMTIEGQEREIDITGEGTRIGGC